MKKFQTLVSKSVASTHGLRTGLKSWEWADANIDYSLVPNYDTPYLSRFDSSRMPFWKDVLDDMRDPAVREVAVLKCSRAGYSENVILTDLRFSICEDPELSFYISAAEDLTKGFLEKRVIRGMGLNKTLKAKFRKAKYKGVDIHFPDMDFRATWSANKTATKQDGYRRIYVDEIDLFPEGTIDAIRRRCSAYAMHHILWGGSIDFNRKGDPSEAPIVKLYEESDKRIWVVPDGDSSFTFELSGLKWDQGAKDSGEWDLERVANTAYYETPSGTRIEEKERMDYVRAGRWEAQSEGIRRGYKVTGFMIPFADNSFGEIAKKFLSAKQRGQSPEKSGRVVDTLRVFFAEYLAEPHWEKKRQTTQEELVDRVADYQHGTEADKTIAIYKDVPASIFACVDVQKDHFWLAVRKWYAVNGGDSALILYQRVDTWEELFAICKQTGVERIYCDAAYAIRQQEVYEVASKTPGFVPVIDNMKLNGLYRRDTIDPHEGTRRQGTGNLITRYTINPAMFRHRLMDLMRGETDQNWLIPRGTPLEYQSQVTAEQFIAGEFRKIRRDNHAFDCEVMQVFAATRARILISYNQSQEPMEETE